MGSKSGSFQRGSSVTLMVPTKRFQVRARSSLDLALDRCARSLPVRVLHQRHPRRACRGPTRAQIPGAVRDAHRACHGGGSSRA